MTIGIPIPQGAAADTLQVAVLRHDGSPVPLQARALDYWSDGSVRWMLLDFQVNWAEGERADNAYTLCVGEVHRADHSHPIQITIVPGGVDITTGAEVFRFSKGGPFPLPLAGATATSLRAAEESGFHLASDESVRFEIADIEVRDAGPLRAELAIRGVAADAKDPKCEVEAVVELFAGSPTLRLGVTVRNPRRANHAGGKWGLGDSASLLFRSAILKISIPATVDRVHWSTEPHAPALVCAVPCGLHQESSGGEHWQGPIHLNRGYRPSPRYRGYRLDSGGDTRQGLRASPVMTADMAEQRLSVAVPQFWQNAPRAIAVRDGWVDVGLWPDCAPEWHELQGGEQKTHELYIALGSDPVSDEALSWCHEPTFIYPPPEYCCGTSAVPYLAASSATSDAGYSALLEAGLDPVHGFFAKREAADEFGWRNFGDIWADHESAFQPADRPLVSHYNNQYDAVAGFAYQFLRTGNPRWWELMTDLARHVRDIDIYHTGEDKSAYNGGLFWHTDHYVDAGLSTHRTYPRDGKNGGGPSAEHNYNVGLMLHYFVTGARASRDAAAGLGEWVLHMDDGTRSAFRWLSRLPTGHASFTAGHYGPGRGAGHSILACVVAHRLTNRDVFLTKAEELIARTAHPDEEVEAHHVQDVELWWSYTAFLQALGVYLDYKEERGACDDRYRYARGILLRFARWMITQERPYLQDPARLEFPTETWVAQDMRKAEVFLWAACHVSGGERQAFLASADRFFRYVVETLASMPGRLYARPLVLLLSNGVRYDWFKTTILGEPAQVALPTTVPWPPRRVFVPQRQIAIRRATWIAVTCLLLTLAGLWLVFVS